jgi:DNA-binding NtrC family response regulator
MQKSAVRAKVLYGECDDKVLKSHAAVMQKAGYEVETAIARREVQQALAQGKFDVVVLGHTLTRDDRHHLPYMAKKANPNTRVLVIHASGKHHEVDLAIDSREDGHRALLEALSELLEPAYA